jgi:RNA polymerase sigma-70 factor, ECF subfamily
MQRGQSVLSLSPSCSSAGAGDAEPRATHARASGEPQPSFAQVYAEHFDLVWRSLHHLGVPPQLLDDAVQDVWLVVHRRLADFDGRSKVGTWLFGISINVARTRRRARDRQYPSEELPDEVQSQTPDPERALVSSRAGSLVQTFLEQLPELTRAIFVSSLLENLSPAETALATGLDVATIYRRVRALRRSFQRFMQRNPEVFE